MAITCDQKIALFNITKQVYFMDVKDIFKVKNKIKGDKTNVLTSKSDQVETSAVESNPILPNVVATLSS